MGYATFTVLEGPLAGRVMDITRRETTIGRSEPADFPPPDAGYPEVSRRHASVTWDGSAFVVQDLASRNGVLVGDQRVEQARLRSGDILTCGDLKLQLTVPEGVPTFDDAPADTASPTFVAAPPMPAAPAASVPAAPAGGGSGRVVALVAGCVVLAVIVLGAAGVGAWMYLRPRSAVNAPVPTSGPDAPSKGGTSDPVAPPVSPPADGVADIEEALRGATVAVQSADAWGVGFHIGQNTILTSRTSICGPDDDDLNPVSVTVRPGAEGESSFTVAPAEIAVYRTQDSVLKSAMMDAAVLRPAETVTALALTMGRSETVSEGDTVTVAGFQGPDRSGGLQLTKVKVLEIVKDGDGNVVVLSLDEELPDGYSGGPVLNEDGVVVGMYSGTMSSDGEPVNVVVSTTALNRIVSDNAHSD